MDNWFESLVLEVGDIWRSTTRLGAVTETMKDIADEVEFGHHEVDLVAQELVRDALQSKKGYTALIAPKKKTQVQVWGYLLYDKFLHVALFDVRTRFEEHRLIFNMMREKHNLEHLCLLTLKTLLKSQHTPEALKKMDVVVSAGVATVTLKDGGPAYVPELDQSDFLAGFTSPGFKGDVTLQLKHVHDL